MPISMVLDTCTLISRHNNKGTVFMDTHTIHIQIEIYLEGLIKGFTD